MKREIDFVKCSPTQNMTILVTTEHRTEEYVQIASKMMSYDHVYAEQVGFIKKPSTREAAAHLEMAGGEFCGNACMALAAYMASEKGMSHNDSTTIHLEASGTNELIACQVKRINDDYLCEVTMPVPKKIEQKNVQYEGDELNLAVVRYPDFFHIVIETDRFDDAIRDKSQQMAKLLGATSGADLIGVLLFKPDSCELAPLIYVPPLGSMIWERGCGSGTASIGAYLAWKTKGAIVASIKQPGGTIRVTAFCHNDEVSDLKIEGTVGIVAQGQAYIDL